MEKIKQFLARKDVVFTLQRYGIDALGAMAQGLFCTLLVGTILNTLGQQFGIGFLTRIIVTVGKGEGAVGYTIGGLASAMVGPGIAVAIGFALHCPTLVLFSLIPVGFAANAMGGAGGPLAVYVVAIVAAECGKLVAKETKIDILVTPIVTVLAGIGIARLVAAPIGTAASAVGSFIKWATVLQPFFMGIVVSVAVGVALTLPISSAAICAALGLTGLAGGAAVAGCCAQMVGFAVMSFRENGWGGLVAQGIGTSMLQIPNIVKNPRIWIPPTLASAITGPLATCLFPSGDERHGGLLRHGHLRLCRADRRLHGLDQRYYQRRKDCHHRHGLDGHGADLLRSSGGAELGFLPDPPEMGLDRGKRPEFGAVKNSPAASEHPRGGGILLILPTEYLCIQVPLFDGVV